jgi:hypothetical protein
VAGGFNAPIAGVFFAIEVGNRYLSRNTVKLDEEAPDGPRADIAAIVLAAIILVCVPLRARVSVLAMRDWREDWFRIGKFTLCLRVRAVAVLKTALVVCGWHGGLCHG